MRAFDRTAGQSLQIGDVTVAVLDVGEDEVLLRIDCPEDVMVEAGNSEFVMEPEWQLE